MVQITGQMVCVLWPHSVSHLCGGLGCMACAHDAVCMWWRMHGSRWWEASKGLSRLLCCSLPSHVKLPGSAQHQCKQRLGRRGFFNKALTRQLCCSQAPEHAWQACFKEPWGAAHPC